MIQPTLTSTATGELATSNAPAMRWCAFPGERLFKRVQQEVNGNPLDEYTYHATNMHREFRVAPNKRLAWDRCVGQEVPEEGFVRQPDWVASQQAAGSSRVRAEVCVGNQTPTIQKTANLEMFIPLLFWYNKDVRLAVPSVAIPYGQRFINIDLASREELVDMYPRGASTWASPAGTITEPTPTLQSIELYINNIFVNPEVHKIYIKRIGFSLIRVHRQQVYNATASSAELLLQQLKWPIEYLFVGMKVKDYNSTVEATRRQHLDKWHTFSSVSTSTYNTTGQVTLRQAALLTLPATGTIGVSIAGVGTGTGLLADALVAGDMVRIQNCLYTVSVGAAAGAAVTGITVFPIPAVAITAAVDATAVRYKPQGLEIQTQTKVKTMNNITIKAHGINIYDNFPTGFFNAYTTYHYGGPNVNAPEDLGALFVPFCLYP